MSRLNHDELGYGLNIDTERHDYVRCARCGWMCLESRDSHFPEGSRAGWGMKYERIFTETTLTPPTVQEIIDETASQAILTESGFELLTEDGDIIQFE
jgi:hypothetical protein